MDQPEAIPALALCRRCQPASGFFASQSAPAIHAPWVDGVSYSNTNRLACGDSVGDLSRCSRRRLQHTISIHAVGSKHPMDF